jgi:hypothetical protein
MTGAERLAEWIGAAGETSALRRGMALRPQPRTIEIVEIVERHLTIERRRLRISLAPSPARGFTLLLSVDADVVIFDHRLASAGRPWKLGEPRSVARCASEARAMSSVQSRP